MSKIGYIISELEKYAKKTAETGEKSYIAALLDIAYCGLRYGASPANYYKFDFYSIGHEKRNTYITNRISRQIIKKYNCEDYIDVFEDKTKFAHEYSKFFGRDWIAPDKCTKEEYDSFVEKNHKFICKPLDGAQGLGISVFDGNAPAFGSADSNIFGGGYILEGFIKQHKAIAAFYNRAVNCLRIITISKNGKVYPIVANFTFGSEYEIANASYGGITCEIDLNTGKLITDGGQFGHKLYTMHPYSGLKFKDFIIPYWKETIKMVKLAGEKVPQVGYIGWDVAITPNGPIIIEGNTTPGYTYFQIPQLLEKRIGTKEKYKKFL